MKRWHYLVILLAAAALAAILMFSNRPARTSGGIVSLAPSVTEILFELGLGGQITGDTDYCDFPAQAKSLPHVGRFGDPDMERLLATRPRLVITTDLRRKTDADQLRQAGIEVLVVKIASVKDLQAAIEQIGKATAHAEQAAALVQRLQNEFSAAAARFKDVPRERRPRVYFELSGSPIMTVGGPSFVNEVIELAGGVNAAAGLNVEWPKVDAETVIAWNPDVIVLGYMDSGASQALAGRIGWAGINAIKNGRVIADISPDLLLRPGPRLAMGVSELSGRLYPK